LAGALATLTLFCAGSASAGAGGVAGGGVLRIALEKICLFLGMSSCPQVPTITQGVLELAALQTAAPDYVRGPIHLGICSVAGNSAPYPWPNGPIIDLQPCSTIALNAVNASVSSRVAVSDLARLTPLAFTTNQLGQAVPTEPNNPSASSFLYVVTTGVEGERNTLSLVYDNPLQTSFEAGQVVAKISLPLQVLSFADGSESLVCCGVRGSLASVAVLQISSSDDGRLSAVVTGDFIGDGTQQSHSAAELGLRFPLGSPAVLASTPNSHERHAIFEVSVPLLVTGPSNTAKCGDAISSQTPDPADCGNDPAYFGSPWEGRRMAALSGHPPASLRSPGSPPAFLKTLSASPPRF
jgi:hypothetical protein